MTTKSKRIRHRDAPYTGWRNLGSFLALCVAFATAATVADAAQDDPFRAGRSESARRRLPHAGGRLCHGQEAGWTSATSMPTGRSFAGVGTINEKLYVVGGRITSDFVYSTTLESYDPITDEWTVETPLPPQARMWGPVVEAVGGKLYALGGLPTNEESWEYDPATGQWTFRGYAGFGSTITNDTTVSGVVDDQVFVVDPDWGGWQVRAYDPVVSRTEEISPRRNVEPRRGTVGGILDRKIYVAGGLTSSWPNPGEERLPPALVADVDVFDIATGTWTTAAPMHTPRGWAESTVMDGKLYVVGGFNGEFETQDFEFVPTMEIYDPTTDTWTEEPGPSTPRYGHGVGAIDGRLYVVGGHDSLLSNPVTVPVATVEIFGRDCRPGRRERGSR